MRVLFAYAVVVVNLDFCFMHRLQGRVSLMASFNHLMIVGE